MWSSAKYHANANAALPVDICNNAIPQHLAKNSKCQKNITTNDKIDSVKLVTRTNSYKE